MAYLDKTGLTHFWGKMKSIFATKEEAENVFFVTCDLVFGTTNTVTNLSHTYNEILEAHNSGKIVRLALNTNDGYTYVAQFAGSDDSALAFAFSLAEVSFIIALNANGTAIVETIYLTLASDFETALGGYSLRTASEGDTGLDGYITFIV